MTASHGLTRRAYSESVAVCIAIDGPSGAGKSTLAGVISDVFPELSPLVLEVEDLCPGWEGLPTAIKRVAEILPELTAHGRVRTALWNWWQMRWEEPRWIPGEGEPPTRLLILTGCGSLAPVLRPWVDVAVWVDAPEDERAARVAARDPYSWEDHWDQWNRDAAVASADGREYAALRVATSSSSESTQGGRAAVISALREYLQTRTGCPSPAPQPRE